jgi:ApaG protein
VSEGPKDAWSDESPDARPAAAPPATGLRASDTTTRGIRVEIVSQYDHDRSSPGDQDYCFLYHVRISNVGAERAKLVSRKWVITDAEGQVSRVEGPGVIGEQPLLAPGGAFAYTSFCSLKTAVGTMHGSYQMVTASGERFDATISPFTLAVPRAIH